MKTTLAIITALALAGCETFQTRATLRLGPAEAHVYRAANGRIAVDTDLDALKAIQYLRGGAYLK